jgi:4-carboxymuconolactone decarboxylase
VRLPYRKGITETVLSKQRPAAYSRVTPKINEDFPMHSERFITGQDMLQQVDGKGGNAVVESLQDIAPDFARYLIEFPFGDIYSRPGLDLRSREIATVAALTALGNASPQLKVHIAAALHVGLTQEEITEVIMQMAVYAGFPAALNGLFAAKEVFAAQQ